MSHSSARMSSITLMRPINRWTAIAMGWSWGSWTSAKSKTGNVTQVSGKGKCHLCRGGFVNNLDAHLRAVHNLDRFACPGCSTSVLCAPNDQLTCQWCGRVFEARLKAAAARKPGKSRAARCRSARGWTCLTSLAATLVALVALGARPAQSQEHAETVFRDARAYTVRIRTQITTPFIEDERGSFSGAGFLVDATRGWVLTNAHVVGHSPSDVTLAFAGGTFRPARKIYVDSFTDVAVLEVAADDRRHPVAPIDCDRVPDVGEAVGAFGHPLGMPFTGTRGIVSGKTDQFLNDFLQIDATVDHGNSGGPVIAIRDARIVGIATAMPLGSKANSLNLATPMRDVCRILKLLQNGVSPEPPALAFSFLVDEDERHSLQVGAVQDTARWPFHPGDRIESVGREREAVTTVTEFVTALRGRRGVVPIRVMRAGRDLELLVRPSLQPSVVSRRAVSLDGALIASFGFEDSAALNEPARLIVHSVEPGSVAEALGMSQMDIIESVDGRRIDDLDSLLGYLRQHHDGTPLRVVFRHLSTSANRWFEFNVRDLPGEETRVIEPEAQLLSSTP